MAAPDRGDIIVINFNPQAGHEQAGRRNAIVLSPKEFNEGTGFISVCPITNQQKGYPFEVELPEEGVPIPGGFPLTGVILTDQVKTLDLQARNVRILKPADEDIEDIVQDCLAKIATYLT